MGGKVKELVETSDNAYTPDTVLAELSRKYFREGVSEKIVRERLATVQAVSHILTINSDLAIYASRAYGDLRDSAKRKKLSTPGLFDGIVLGAARMKDAKVVTADPHFKDLPETGWI